MTREPGLYEGVPNAEYQRGLTDPHPLQPTAEEVAACTDIDELRDWWHAAGPETRALIEARRDELTAGEPA